MNLTSRILNSLPLIFLLLIISSCEKEDLGITENNRKKLENIEDNPLVSRIVNLGFNIEDIQEENTFFLVEGDIIFYKDSLSNTDQKNTLSNGKIEQWHTDGVVTSQNVSNISVWINPNVPNEWVSDINFAISEWNSINNSGIRLFIADNSAASINISAQVLTGSLGRGSFPLNGLPGSALILNLWNQPQSMRRLVIAHEIGHCLGFRHTNFQGRSNESQNNANIISGTPQTDPNSIMNTGDSPNHSNGWNGFSVFDRIAAQTLYHEWPLPAGSTPLLRYRHNTGKYFFTTNINELGAGGNGWTCENALGYALGHQATGTIPLYRYYNSTHKMHFYTTNFNELGQGGSGYAYETIACYVHGMEVSGTVPVYRYLNNNNGTHLFTQFYGELGAGNNTWNYEGIAFYIRR